MTNRPARIVVLISGVGSIMAALARACEAPETGARVACVVSDRDDAPGLALAAAAGLPTAVVRPRDFPDRATWDQALARTVGAFEPDLVVLAGFMRIVGPGLIGAYPDRIVNTHPSLLPAFPGATAVADALAAGVATTGCTVMLADEGVDTGPILAQAVVEVREDDTVQTLHERIKEAERPLVVATVRGMIAEGWSAGDRAISLDLTREGTGP